MRSIKAGCWLTRPGMLPVLPQQPDGVAWPTESWPTAPLPETLDQTRLNELLDRAFGKASTLGETHALLAIQGGRIVLERYREGDGPETTYPSWSIAKSMAHALVGLARQDGVLDSARPTGIEAWQGPDDRRAEITLEDLLRMSSGLAFHEDYVDAGTSDTIEMLYGAGKADVARYAIERPLLHAPGTFWSYSSGTTNIVCAILAEALALDRAGMEDFMRTRLFAPLGVRSAIPKFDAAGTFIGSSFCFCSARDFARFGLLYLRGGMWDGQALLPAEWVDHARTPTDNVPAEEPMRYGAHWWLDMAGPGSFSANGYDGQYIVLVPDRDLILVRHGASEAQKDDVRAWLADLAACF
jgi:CubicO group peptidase (beta-lactamase class C family)